MSDPKSMERLVARFESNRDKHSVRLLYCSWCDEHEPLSADDLPESWKRHRPIFRVEAEDGFEGLIIVASKDALAKSKVLETCRTAAQTFHNELEKHGFEPDPGFDHPEANWLKALVSAAMDDKLGFEGFNEGDGVIRFDGDSEAPTDSKISSDEIEWCDSGLLPRSFVPMRNIAEASLILLDRLSKEPEQKPKRSSKVNPDEVLAHYVENDPFWCMTHDIDEIAIRSGFSEGAISGSDVYKEKIQPMQKKAGTFRKNKKKLRAALETGDIALLNENQRSSFEYLKSYVEDNGSDENDDL